MQVLPAAPRAETTAETIYERVRAYYGQTLRSSADLKTSACCPPEAAPAHHRPILSLLPDEVLTRFYGCGSPLPSALDGCTVLDLGCGTGRDAFVAAALAGPDGRVIGVDMTDEQLDVARRHEEAVARAFGFGAPTTRFLHGRIEDLAALGLEDESVDVVISNCVLNLSPDKEAALREAWRVLRPGGELYFSDIYADRRLAAELQADPVLLGECLGGALYTEDFRRIMARVGCPDVRTVSASPLTVGDAALARRLGAVRFTSRTVRAFKLGALEDRCEDFGQVATYRGGALGQEHVFVLDDHHAFEARRPVRVCGNTAAMLQETRLGRYFDVAGDRSTHFGAFACAPVPAAAGAAACGC
ncbi:MAG: methyltransferase domain-containing protein [Rubricoccaceae bacterium]